MSIKGVSTYSVSLQFSEVGGNPYPGSVVSYLDDSGVEHHFVITFYSAGIKSFGIKPIGGLGKINPGLLPGYYLRSLDKSFYIKIGNNSISLSDGSKIHQINSVTDIRDSFLSNRHSLITNDARGIRWNEAFMDGSQYSYSECDLSFLSLSFPYEKELINGTYASRPDSIIALNSKFGIMSSKDVEYYKSQPILFLDRDSNNFHKIEVMDFVNLGEFTSTNFLNTEKDPDYINQLKLYTLCVFKDNKYLNEKVNFANFASNISAFNSPYDSSDMLALSNISFGGFIRSKNLGDGSGYEYIKNINSIQDTVAIGCFDGDYVNEFVPYDDGSLLFLKYENKNYCVGRFRYADTSYVSGCNMINGRYVAEGRNSFGEFSKSLIDSENYCSINKIELFFDNRFFNVVNAVIDVYGEANLNYSSIGDVNLSMNGNDVDRSYQQFEQVTCLHTSVVGDTFPAYLDGKYRFDDSCDNYVPGSAYLDRDVRPITKNVNTKGLAEKSTGLAFRPNYAYKPNQSKSFSLPFSGTLDLVIPFMNPIKDILLDYNFIIRENVDLGLKVDDENSSMQIKNLYMSGLSCIEDNNILSGADGVLKYIRKDGSLSNVVRHNDALLLLCMSLQFLSFLNENSYAKNMSTKPSLVFDFGKSGRSKSVKLSFNLYCNNKSIYQLTEDGITYYVSSHDRDLAIIEIKRLVKSLRNFYGGFSSSVYQDLLKTISYYDSKYKNSSLSSLKERIIDAAHLITKFDFYIKGLGDPLVDVFGISENSIGKVNIEKISELSLNDKSLKNYYPSNTSKNISKYSAYKTMSQSGISSIWSGLNLFSGTIRSPYVSDKSNASAPSDVANAIEAIIRKWINGIESVSVDFDGYILEAKDDICIVDGSELSSRNHILISSLKNRSNVLSKQNFRLGISYSCITDIEFRGRTGLYVNNGYLVDGRRIFEYIVKPSINAGARVVLQDQNIDKLIIDNFTAIDNALNGIQSKQSEDAICFFENIYDPDYPNSSKLYDIDENESAVFEGVKFSSISQNAFVSYENYKGSYYFDSHESYKASYAPQGADILDANVDLDRLNDRKRVLYVSQNLISEQISYIVDSISSYEVGENVQKSLLVYGYRSSALSAPKRLTCNLFGHNFFNFVMVKLGEEVQDSNFTHNIFMSPYGGLKANRVHSFNSDDNFVMKKIFHRSSDIKDCYVERSILADWGKIKNLHPIPPNEFATSDGFNVSKGEGSNNNDDDIIFRLRINNLPNIKNYTINGII